MKKLAILASGNGSNAENIQKFFANGNRVKVELVIYDRRNALVAERMRNLGVDTLFLPKEVWTDRPAEILEILREREIDLIVLAGFLRFVPEEITSAYAGRIINIHPSLLPAYAGPGMYGHKVHEAVIANGDKKSGVTVHYVTNVIDSGDIIMQQEVDVDPDDTPESLEAKIHDVEYSLFPRAIVAALNALSNTAAAPLHTEAAAGEAAATPEPSRSAEEPAEAPESENTDREWAETLGVNYNPDKLPPRIPGVTPPDTERHNAPTPPPASARAPRPGAGLPDNYPPMPPAYLVWAVIMTVLCCMPAGIVAIIFSSQVSSRYYAGDFEGAEKASERAQIWIIVSFVVGVLVQTLYLPLSLLF